MTHDTLHLCMVGQVVKIDVDLARETTVIYNDHSRLEIPAIPLGFDISDGLARHALHELKSTHTTVRRAILDGIQHARRTLDALERNVTGGQS